VKGNFLGVKEVKGVKGVKDVTFKNGCLHNFIELQS
jgi:hypothetical protein